MKAEAFLAIQQCAVFNRKHKDYKHTVKYAEKLHALSVANEESVESLLRQFNRRETHEEFEQRKKITKLLTGAVINRIEVPFAKASRTDGITTTFSTGDKISDNEPSYTASFIGDKTVFDFITEDLRTTRRNDPNAFIAVEFDAFDANKEKAKAYPVIYKSEKVYDFKYVREKLDYLVVEKAKGSFLVYFDGGNMSLEIVENEDYNGALNSDKPVDYSIVKDVISQGVTMRINSSTVMVKEYSHKNENKIMAHRIGYLPDEATEGRTCVTHYHSALNRLERMLIANSESDITRALHVFPQKIMVTEKCRGFKNPDGGNIGCNNGYESGTSNVCRNCGGSGLAPVNKSAQDVIYVSVDRSQQYPDLSKIMVYVRPDLETAKYLEDWIEKTSGECLKDVFAGNAFSTPAAQQTATYVQVNYESVYDAVTPYCKKTSRLFEFITSSRAWIENDKDVTVTHTYPIDLELESISELVEQYKNSSSAPIEVRKRLRDKIIRRSMNNEPVGMKKAIIKMIHEPFSCMTDTERSEIMASGLVPKRKRVLWANYEDIMNQLFEDDSLRFIEMTFNKREEEIAKKVDAIIQEVAPTVTI